MLLRLTGGKIETGRMSEAGKIGSRGRRTRRRLQNKLFAFRFKFQIVILIFNIFFNLKFADLQFVRSGLFDPLYDSFRTNNSISQFFFFLTVFQNLILFFLFAWFSIKWEFAINCLPLMATSSDVRLRGLYLCLSFFSLSLFLILSFLDWSSVHGESWNKEKY